MIPQVLPGVSSEHCQVPHLMMMNDDNEIPAVVANI